MILWAEACDRPIFASKVSAYSISTRKSFQIRGIIGILVQRAHLLPGR